MPNHDVRAIANEFWRLAQKRNIYLTNMQLQKLPYFAYGYSLVLGDKSPLISEHPQAWPYGPVFPTLYDALGRYGSGGVLNLIHENDGNPWASSPGQVYEASLTQNEKDIIQGVWNGYGHMSAFKLSDLTHQPGTPWEKTINQYGRANIPDEYIREAFQKLIKNY